VSLLLLASTSDNTPAGQNFTLWFPAGLFIIVAVIFYLQVSRPHRRVPPRQPVQAGAASTASASVKEDAAGPGDAGTEAGE
jgi:hypothetical protein